MFEVNRVYANRKGKYTVLAVEPPKMRVRYEDGSEAELNINIQARIWENIEAEQEAQASRNSRRKSQPGGRQTQHFIKVATIATEEMLFPGWQERVVMTPDPQQAKNIKKGDRLIYYALEAQVFFAVATITGEATEVDPKDYFFQTEAETTLTFPIDKDAVVASLEHGVAYDSMELESYPDFKKLTLRPETFLKISEDDFELLAELLTEVTEVEDEDELDDEDYLEEDE